MRILGLTFCLIAAGFASTVAAQSPTDGPLAAQGASETAPAHVPKGRKTATKASHRTDAKRPRTLPDSGGPAVPVAVTRQSGAPTDPLSLGMKWNGSNDNSEKTRVQNYDGNAAGTGAAVGLNYHF